MMHNYKDLSGEKFGRLTVVADVGRNKHGTIIQNIDLRYANA